jgi:hypothetical protein
MQLVCKKRAGQYRLVLCSFLKDFEMKTQKLFLAGALLVLAQSTGFAEESVKVAALDATPALVADHPSMKDGDSWTYSYHDTKYGQSASTVVQTVTSVDSSRLVIEWKNRELGTSGTEYFDAEFNKLTRGTKLLSFSWPLQEGKVLKQEFDYGSGGKNFHSKRTITTVGQERVTVPAGEFNTWKIVIKSDYSGYEAGRNWSGTLVDTLWYSPLVKNIVKIQTIDYGISASPLNKELLSYAVQ